MDTTSIPVFDDDQGQHLQDQDVASIETEGVFICPEPLCMRPYTCINSLRVHCDDVRYVFFAYVLLHIEKFNTSRKPTMTTAKCQ